MKRNLRGNPGKFPSLETPEQHVSACLPMVGPSLPPPGTVLLHIAHVRKATKFTRQGLS